MIIKLNKENNIYENRLKLEGFLKTHKKNCTEEPNDCNCKEIDTN